MRKEGERKEKEKGGKEKKKKKGGEEGQYHDFKGEIPKFSRGSAPEPRPPAVGWRPGGKASGGPSGGPCGASRASRAG